MEEYNSLVEIAKKLEVPIRKLLCYMLLMQQEKQDYLWNLKILLINIKKTKLLSM